MLGQGQCFCVGVGELSHGLFPCFGLGLWLILGIVGKLCGHLFKSSLPCVGADNKAFFVISMSEKGAHIYELVAQTVSEKNV